MHVLFSAAVIFPCFSSLILGGQIVHINEGEIKLALFNTKENVLLTPRSSFSSTINYLPLFFFLVAFCFLSTTSTTHLDPTLTPHRPYSQLLSQHSVVNSEAIYNHCHHHHHHHRISIVFPPPPPHFYCFSSTTTTTPKKMFYLPHSPPTPSMKTN